MKFERGTCRTGSVIDRAEAMGLETRLLYEAVIELASEGLLTSRCVNAAAGVVLTQLGLPEYFFRNISKDALKRVLRAVANNVQVREDDEVILRSEVSEAQFDIDGGVQARIATPQNRDRMEAVLNPVMSGNRVEYYFSPESHYYTYIVYPQTPPPPRPDGPTEELFAFSQSAATPRATVNRYVSFLKRSRRQTVPLVEVSASPNTGETRIMFGDDFSHSVLPVLRQMLDSLGLVLQRAYWETYRGSSGRLESVCSLYLAGNDSQARVQEAVANIRSLLAIQSGDLDDLYVSGQFTFAEYIFATAAAAFVHSFIHKDQQIDLDIMGGLGRKDLRDAFAHRIFGASRAEYTQRWVLEAVRRSPDLVKWLYRLFDRKFNPVHKTRPSAATLAREIARFRGQAAIAFVDDRTGYDIFSYMSRMVTDVLKTNFYKSEKRSHAFRLDPKLLDPLVFTGPVYGVFFVLGFYATATHMRAEDVARGGVRLIRVTPSNHGDELDNMPLLNYALGPVAQRLKHKDIAESGAKGVVVPHQEFPHEGLRAVLDFSEGVMDLTQPSDEVIDYLGQPEMLFFGPDEGTAGFMDAVAYRARERGYKYWRTATTGKSFGIPHDEYGLTCDRRVFGLISRGSEGTELEIEGVPVLTTTDPSRLYAEIGDQIDTSGMTTMGVMTTLRTVLAHAGMPEKETNLMITGGPDGDLGANQIQSFRGRICLVVDGGSVLFDPDGLDRQALMTIAMARHTSPRLDSMAYPEAKLGPRGFRIPRQPGTLKLPDGTVVPDGAFFHRSFLFNPEVHRYIAQAKITAFVPCGGFKDTINGENVRQFLETFTDLKVIVEGANVFFDDASREHIARETDILQIKDSSANKGGVTSSAIAEVLSAFLLGDSYERFLVEDARTRSGLIRSVLDLIAANAVAETEVLLALHQKTGTPLYTLSVQTSEELMALQQQLYTRLDDILAQPEVVRATIAAYVPEVLMEHLGMAKVLHVLKRPELQAYRNAILTKKIAAMALYKYAADWEAFLGRLEADFAGEVRRLVVQA
ncbi:MAG: NAD-glutamate dehydrogenase domain-containing protein [Armatimonadia bacterium]